MAWSAVTLQAEESVADFWDAIQQFSTVFPRYKFLDVFHLKIAFDYITADEEIRNLVRQIGDFYAVEEFSASPTLGHNESYLSLRRMIPASVKKLRLQECSWMVRFLHFQVKWDY